MLCLGCCANCIYGSTIDCENNRVCRFNGVVDSNFKCKKYKVLPASVDIDASFIRLTAKAADILARFYSKVLDDVKYLNSMDTELKNAAVKALSNLGSKENMDKLFTFLRDDTTARTAIASVSRIIEDKPEYINTAVQVFESEKDTKVRQRLAEILSGKSEYFIMKLTSKNMKSAAGIIRQLLLLGRTSEVIDFMNKNRDIDIENELVAIIKEVIPSSGTIEKEFSAYLHERLIKKCGLARHEEAVEKREKKKDKMLMHMLCALIVCIVMVFPVVYAIRHFDILFKIPFIEQIKIYVKDFNYYLVYYSASINAIYIVLMVISYFQVRHQSKRLKIKNFSFLFKKRMLPSISIIAPAYNEEKTIIESENSLLNLKYPDYELVIVNDGSKDRTLEVLINYFALVRVEHIFEYKLKTKLIRGIYMNSSMPRLIVVDKENGGKADSLNAGINISKNEYFCGIDADSLLEDEALLRLASLTLDEPLDVSALGGNIFPINGCTVERGQIKKIRIPRNKLAGLQTVEYIRAFMSGRLGWAALNSLLIISGACGLFKKELVLNTGGYLTSSGKYAKNTVGEDMELVVRISRFLREMRVRYRICYAYNANCWTEVPEDMKSLKKQRYRWHKGLIDILMFHKKMLFNPGYRRIGMIAMPYFFLFEMLDPLVEFQGYAMIIAAFFWDF